MQIENYFRYPFLNFLNANVDKDQYCNVAFSGSQWKMGYIVIYNCGRKVLGILLFVRHM